MQIGVSESLLFYYIMILDITKKSRVSSYCNDLINILLPWKQYQVSNYPLKRIYLYADTELALCFGRGQCAASSYLKCHCANFIPIPKPVGLFDIRHDDFGCLEAELPQFF